jgi:hypothetical protein
MCKKAGLRATEEPRTYDLLLRFFTPLQCRVLFHKSPNKQHVKATEALMVLMRQASDKNTKPSKREELVRRIDTEMQVLQALMKGTSCEVKEDDRQGLRVDIEVVDRRTGATKWLDFTSVHSTCKSYLKAELRATELNIKAFQAGLPEKQWPQRAGARATKAEKDKRALYGQLVMVGRRQQLRGLRKSKPGFAPLVVTTHGEMGLAMIEHQEWATAAYRDKITRESYDNPREDGQSVKHLTAQYRTQYRTGVQVAVAKGEAKMLSEAGLPMTL